MHFCILYYSTENKYYNNIHEFTACSNERFKGGSYRECGQQCDSVSFVDGLHCGQTISNLQKKTPPPPPQQQRVLSKSRMFRDHSE